MILEVIVPEFGNGVNSQEVKKLVRVRQSVPGLYLEFYKSNDFVDYSPL